MFRYLPAILHVSKLIWQFFERVCHASSSGQSSLQMNWSVIVVIYWAIYNLLKVILWLLSFRFISLYDWSWKLAPVSQPIRYKTKINQDFVTRVFPRFGRVIIVVSVYETQLKSALYNNSLQIVLDDMESIFTSSSGIHSSMSSLLSLMILTQDGIHPSKSLFIPFWVALWVFFLSSVIVRGRDSFKLWMSISLKSE